MESAIAGWGSAGLVFRIGLSVILALSFFGVWKATHRWHERRVLAVSLIAYASIYALTLGLAHLRAYSNHWTIFLIESVMSLSRLMISAGAATFLMQHLCHLVTGSSVIFTPALILGFYESLSNYTTSTLSKGYSEVPVLGLDLTAIMGHSMIYLCIATLLTVLTLWSYGSLRPRYRYRIACLQERQEI